MGIIFFTRQYVLDSVGVVPLLTKCQHQPRQLLLQGIAAVKQGTAPADNNALDVSYRHRIFRRWTNS
jgi:hypothetical protein